ncbi:hypothetical protein [Fluviispira multicolorata]|uniref:Uncharacterized protein n=1 Tax=Fluviispira multicolorata TaxID=2654512 RepID=A0A833JF82_9BACT|nr:hypothetical protein [Fluviispira multicolorata]KAB8033599.1 hypothetical protein GCL57_02510 [Fluviispira multicolorata]
METGIISMINPQRGMIGVTLSDRTYSAIEILDSIDFNDDLFGQKVYGPLREEGSCDLILKSDSGKFKISAIIQNAEGILNHIIERVGLGCEIYCSREYL